MSSSGSLDTEPQYSPIVSEYFWSTPNAGKPVGNSVGLFLGQAGDREQGIEVAFHMRVDGQVIAEIRFQVFGCPHAIAACGLAAERLAGQPVGALMELKPESLRTALDAPVEKMGRLLVVQDALRNCFLAWDNRGLEQG